MLGKVVVWNSGKVSAADRSILMPEIPAVGKKYTWQVRVWDKTEKAPVEPTCFFSNGFFKSL